MENHIAQYIVKQKRISGKEAFGQLVEALYEMKIAGCSDAKKILFGATKHLDILK